MIHRNMPVFFVVLDGCGEVIDFLKLNHFLKRKNSYWESEKEDKVCSENYVPPKSVRLQYCMFCRRQTLRN